MPRPHPPEFRWRAVEHARERHQPVAELARFLGISESCLRNWMSRADVEGGRRDGTTTDELAELHKLGPPTLNQPSSAQRARAHGYPRCLARGSGRPETSRRRYGGSR